MRTAGWLLLSVGLLLAPRTYAAQKIVARVNDTAIDQQQLQQEIQKRLPYASYHASISKEKYNQIQQQALDHLIEQELIYQEARRRGMQVDRSQLDAQIQSLRKKFATKEAWKKALKHAGLNEKKLREHYRREMLIQHFLQTYIYNQVKITDEDLRRYYNENQSKFIIPKRYRVRHILISVDPGALPEGWKAGLEKAEKVYKRLLLGEDFAKLAAEVSEDTTSNRKGGDLGWFHKGQLIPELDQALEKLKIGEISGPIRSIYGYHILRLEGVKPRRQLTFDEIDHDRLRQRLYEKTVEQKKNNLLARLKSEADIEILLQ